MIRQYERRLGNIADLRKPEIKAQISQEVRELIQPLQGTFEGVDTLPAVEEIVSTVAETVADKTIAIPEIIVIPKRPDTTLDGRNDVPSHAAVQPSTYARREQEKREKTEPKRVLGCVNRPAKAPARGCKRMPETRDNAQFLPISRLRAV